jgi:hypothetical protein
MLLASLRDAITETIKTEGRAAAINVVRLILKQEGKEQQANCCCNKQDQQEEEKKE